MYVQYNTTAEAKLFRLRFRVPYKLFVILLDWTEAFIESKEKTRDCTGHPKVPISLKLLGVLRILGRGTCYDGIKKLSDMSETTIKKKSSSKKLLIKSVVCWKAFAVATILLRNSFDPNLERNGEALSEFTLDDKYRRSN